MKYLISMILCCISVAVFSLVPKGTLIGPLPVVKVLDGDTIRIADHFFQNTVRLIGIDTPEVYGKVQPFGPEASAFTKQLLTSQHVWVELDSLQHDRYGRMLAYVYLESDEGDWTSEGRHFIQANLEIIKSGLAKCLPIAPNIRYKDLYEEAEHDAQEKKLNLWK